MCDLLWDQHQPFLPSCLVFFFFCDTSKYFGIFHVLLFYHWNFALCTSVLVYLIENQGWKPHLAGSYLSNEYIGIIMISTKQVISQLKIIINWGGGNLTISISSHLHPWDVCLNVVKHGPFQIGQVVQVPPRVHILFLLRCACIALHRKPTAMLAWMEISPILHSNLFKKRRIQKRTENSAQPQGVNRGASQT